MAQIRLHRKQSGWHLKGEILSELKTVIKETNFFRTI